MFDHKLTMQQHIYTYSWTGLAKHCTSTMDGGGGGGAVPGGGATMDGGGGGALCQGVEPQWMGGALCQGVEP